jgi:hypothetical protein
MKRAISRNERIGTLVSGTAPSSPQGFDRPCAPMGAQNPTRRITNRGRRRITAMTRAQMPGA